VKSGQGALGFRVKSGRAVFVLIEGSIRAPRLRQRDVINLSDPRNPDTRQPYHAAMGKLETNAATLKRRFQSVRRATERSIADLIQRCADDGCAIHRAALVVGSLIDPESIANPHIRAHALEGRLFRRVLEDALRSRGIQCAIFTERDVYPTASNLLGQSPIQIRRTIAEFGRSASVPWRADQKAAAVAAWTSLEQ
jgi:hypothetical protein